MADKKEEEKVTLSFGCMNDLNWMEGTREDIVFSSMDDLKEKIGSEVKKCLEKKSCPSYMNLIKVKDVVSGLLSNEYYVCNRFEKYYVIAFALNGCKFEVFSKDFDKKTVEWGLEKYKDKKVKGTIEDPDYNESPVIKIMQIINGREQRKIK